MTEYRSFLIVEIKAWKGLSEVHVNLEKTAYGPDILPVPVEKIAVHIFFRDGGRDDFFSKIFV